MLVRFSSAVESPPGAECFTGGAFGAVEVSVQFHQFFLKVVAGGADKVDVAGGGEDFGDVGVVVH